MAHDFVCIVSIFDDCFDEIFGVYVDFEVEVCLFPFVQDLIHISLSFETFDEV